MRGLSDGIKCVIVTRGGTQFEQEEKQTDQVIQKRARGSSTKLKAMRGRSINAHKKKQAPGVDAGS